MTLAGSRLGLSRAPTFRLTDGGRHPDTWMTAAAK